MGRKSVEWRRIIERFTTFAFRRRDRALVEVMSFLEINPLKIHTRCCFQPVGREWVMGIVHKLSFRLFWFPTGGRILLPEIDKMYLQIYSLIFRFFCTTSSIVEVQKIKHPTGMRDLNPGRSRTRDRIDPPTFTRVTSNCMAISYAWDPIPHLNRSILFTHDYDGLDFECVVLYRSFNTNMSGIIQSASTLVPHSLLIYAWLIVWLTIARVCTVG